MAVDLPRGSPMTVLRHRLVLAAFLPVLVALPAHAFWTATPVGPFDLRVPTNSSVVRAVSDGAGGAIVMVENWSGQTALRRIGSDGLLDPRWSLSVPGQAYCEPDGQGGILVALSGTAAGVFLRRLAIDATPYAGWPAEGIRLVADGSNYARVVADGTGGAIVSWLSEQRGNYVSDVFARAHHVLANGVLDPAWGLSPRTVLSGQISYVVSFPSPIMCGDGAGGAFVGWQLFTGWGGTSTPFPYEIHRLFVSHVPVDVGVEFGVNARAFDLSTQGSQNPLGLAPAGTDGFTIAWYGATGHKQEFVARDGTSQGPKSISHGGWVLHWCPQTDGSVLHLNATITGATATEIRVHRSLRDGSPAPGWPEAGATFVNPAALWRNAAGYFGKVTSDGAGGAFAFWTARGPGGAPRVFAQHLGSDGAVDPNWPAAGQPLAPVDAQIVGAIATAPGEAIALMVTLTNAVLVQRVTIHPDRTIAAPAMAVRDVPEDQGGRVLVRWESSPLEGPPWSLVNSYRIWRRPADGAGAWELVDIRLARPGGHVLQLATFADSTAAGDRDMHVRVDAVLANDEVLASSDVLSVSSVDDLAPGVPGTFAVESEAAGVRLSWSPSDAPDLAGYRLYRSANPGTPLEQAIEIGFTQETEYFDPAAGKFHFQLVAEDIHGNRSVPLESGLEGVPVVPAALSFGPPQPSPARSVSRFRFSLPVGSDASLAVYDVSGRRVAHLPLGLRPRGWHDFTWNLRDASGRLLPAGLYVVRLVTAMGSAQQRLLLVP